MYTQTGEGFSNPNLSFQQAKIIVEIKFKFIWTNQKEYIEP